MVEKLNPLALGLAAGIVWGVVAFLCAVGAAYYGYGVELVALMASVHPGYGATLGGAVIGAVYGFIDGLIACYVVGWLYNALAVKKAKGRKRRR